jgi:hypothetical protein
MPADAVGDTQGVCHDELSCNLYTQDCGPEPYARACIVYDEDTNACWVAGLRTAGERCDEGVAATACEAGLLCSTLDHRCYALCDPNGGTCDGPLVCHPVRDSTGEPWFGLCS